MAGKYSPKSMARAVRFVGRVTNPPRVTDLLKPESEVDRWEELVKTLKRDFTENLSNTAKVGIVTTMMPESVQEMVYQAIGKIVCYDDIVQNIRAAISNKVAMRDGADPHGRRAGEVPVRVL